MSANEVIATFFWHALGEIHIDYFQEGKTINSKYYANFLGRMNNDLKEKTPHSAKKSVLFRQEHAREHTCVVAMAKFDEMGHDMLSSAIFSSNNILFPILKKWLSGKRFSSNEGSSLKQMSILSTWTNLIFFNRVN